MSTFLSDAVLINLSQENLLDQAVKAGLKSKTPIFRGIFNPEFHDASLNGWITADGEINTLAAERAMTASLTASSLDTVEQWYFEYKRYGDRLDLHDNNVKFNVGKSFDQKMRQLGQSIGYTLGSLARARAYNAAVQGNTLCTATGTTVTVDSLNGFTRNLYNGRYDLISVDNPLTIYANTTGSTWVEWTAVGYSTSAKTLTILETVSPAISSKVPLIAETASRIAYVDKTNKSITDVTSGDTLTWEALDRASLQLQDAGVPRFSDGYYYVYLTANQMAKLLASTEVRNSFLGMGVEGMDNPYLMGSIQAYSGLKFVVCDAPSSSHASTLYDFATVNAGSVQLEYALVVGAEGTVERRVIDTPSASGNLILTNSMIEGNFDGCRLVVKDAGDSLAQNVSFSWEWLGDFIVRTDLLCPTTIAANDAITGNAAVKRMVAVVSAK
jgi:hypothetical protein